MTKSITPRQLAAKWQCSLGHIYELIATGQLTASNIGVDPARRPRYVISVDSVAAFENARAVIRAAHPSNTDEFGAHRARRTVRRYQTA